MQQRRLPLLPLHGGAGISSPPLTHGVNTIFNDRYRLFVELPWGTTELIWFKPPIYYVQYYNLPSFVKFEYEWWKFKATRSKKNNSLFIKSMFSSSNKISTWQQLMHGWERKSYLDIKARMDENWKKKRKEKREDKKRSCIRIVCVERDERIGRKKSITNREYHALFFISCTKLDLNEGTEKKPHTQLRESIINGLYYFYGPKVFPKGFHIQIL